MLSNQVLSCLQLQVKNHVKISFIVLSYHVLSRLKLENHVKNTFHIVALRWKIKSKYFSCSYLEVENHVKILFI